MQVTSSSWHISKLPDGEKKAFAFGSAEYSVSLLSENKNKKNNQKI